MMPNVVMPKKIIISFSFIVRLSITASGKLNAATAIINARAVPRGNPFWNKTTTMGTIAAQLPYMGTPISVAIGTERNPALLTMREFAFPTFR
jgi:hypothetical protein